MRRATRHRLAIAVLCLWASVGAHALGLADLQRLLKSAPAQPVAFEEQRESPYLAAPVSSRGTLSATQDWLEKRISAPRKETWRLGREHIEWISGDGASHKQMDYAQTPALAALANAMRQIVNGDLTALGRDFDIVIAGDERAWTATLQPRAAELSRHLIRIDLQGAGARLQAIVIDQRNGERTITRLMDSPVRP